MRNFAKLRTKDAYPGVDVVYYGDQRRLEFDFVVAPMADPRAIALTLSGMDRLFINADGDLVAEVNGHPVRFAKPYAYQKVSGSAQAVSVEYTLAAPGKVQLKIGDYDKNLELVIDPTLSYSTYLGGSQGDTANGIAVDTAGNAYITGQTCSIGQDQNPILFPAPTPNPSNTTVKGVSPACNAYVTKLDPTGATVLFTTFISGVVPTAANGSASGNGIALDDTSLNPTPVPNGYPNVYVVGTTSFQDMPIPLCGIAPCPVGFYQDPAYTSASPNWPGGDTDPFIAILNSTTGTLIRTTYLGGNGLDAGYGIAVDPQQNVIVAGKTSSFNFPAYNGFEPITEAYVAFVTKLDFGLHIALPILPGASPMSPRAASHTDFCGSTCPTTPDPTSAYYFFSAVYGGQLVAPPQTWTYVIGAPIAAGTITTLYPTCAVTEPPTNYPALRVVAQNGGTTAGINWVADNLCTTGVIGNVVPDNGINWLVVGVAPWITPLSASTEAYGVALDSTGGVFAVGGSSTSQLHPSLPGPGYTAGGTDWLPLADTYWNGTGSWIIKLHGQDTSTGSKNAGRPVYVTALETNMTDNSGNVDAAKGVAIDSQGAAYVVGTTTGSIQAAIGRTVGLNESPLGAAPSTDAYILKMQSPSQIVYATYLGGTGNDQGLGVAVDGGGYAYIIGSTQSTDIPVINAVVDGSGNTLSTLNNPQHAEAYIAKMTQDGTALIMSAYLGGNSGDQGNAIALSKSGNGDIYLAGNTNSSNFPIVPIVSPTNPVVFGRNTYANNGDAFVTKISGASFPKITLSTSNLNFLVPQAVDWASTAAQMQSVTLTNSGTATLHFLSPGIAMSESPSSFSIYNNTCGTPPNAQLLPGSSCTVTVSFTPSQAVSLSGTLEIPDDAPNSPQPVALSGTGVLVKDSVSPTALTFASTLVGQTAATQTVTLTNADPTYTLIPGSVVPNTNPPATSPEFSAISGCNTNLLPGQSCTITVSFTPNMAGTQSGSLIVNTGNGYSIAPIALQGVGSGQAISPAGACSATDICVTGPTGTVTVTKGTPQTFSINVTIPSGFTGSSIALNCAPPANVTCTISPNPIPIVSGTTTYPATVTVSVPTGNTITVSELLRPGRLLATLLPFGGIGLIFAGRRRRWLLMLGLIVCLALGMVNCGGGSSSSSNQQQLQITTTPAGSQPLVVPLSIS